MDPEMIKLLAAAKAGNKNLSGTLNNLDNPLYTLIAGVYDPLAAQSGGSAGGGGPLWSQYAGETNPIMRDLMMKIQNGTNKFYLGSYIDSLKPEDVQATGYSPSDLKGLATGLLKEYTDGASGGSGGSKDTLAKAGYRSPTDLYSTSDMPIGKQGAAGLTKISKEQDGVQKAMKAAQLAASKAMSGLGPLFNGFDSVGRAKSPSVDQMMNYISNNHELKNQIPNGSMRQIDPATGDIYESRGTQQHRSYGTFDPRNLLNIIDIPLQEGFRTLEQLGSSIKGQQTPNIQNMLAGQMLTEKAVSKVKKAKRQEGLATGQANAAASETELYKKGMMRALAETGRTPLGDQLKTMLKFAAQVK
jgi:hypothetical protein